MKLYTRTGDDGTTGLIGGGRARKDTRRVSAYGDVDELNAVLGWAGLMLEAALVKRTQHIQSMLFVMGAELATDPKNTSDSSRVSIEDSEVRELETWIDEVPSIETTVVTIITR